MVEEVGQQRDVVAGALLDLKGVARKSVVPVGDAELLCDFRRDSQHARPVDGHDFGGRISLSEDDPEDAVTGGNIENADCAC
jgi:hypothetical protein